MNSAYEKKLLQRIEILENKNLSLENQLQQKKRKMKEYNQRPEVKERNRRKANEYYQRNKEKILQKAKEKYIEKKIQKQNAIITFD